MLTLYKGCVRGKSIVGELTDSAPPLSKSDVLALVKKRFGHLGEDAIELVTQLALSPRRMRNFLVRLNLDPDRDLQAQLDVLFFYLVRQTDLRTFLMRVRFELAKDGREPTRTAYEVLEVPEASEMPISKPLSAPVPSTPSVPKGPPAAPIPIAELVRERQRRVEVAASNATATIPVMRRESDAQPLSGTEILRAEPLAGIIELEPKAVPTAAPLAGIVPLQAPAATEPEPEPVREQPMINEAGYTGLCRRVGKPCRRLIPDRRAKLASIMSNRRYGGDRRKVPQGRRKTDPPR